MKVNSLFRTLAVVAAASALSPAGFAQTLLNNAPVTVSVTLSSKCRFETSAPASLAVDFGTYVAFVGPASPATPQQFNLECTRNFGTAPTVTWDDTADGDADGKGVIAGLQYTLSLTGAQTSAGTSATPTVAGTPRVVQYTLSGNMAAGQAGDASAGASHVRTVTMSF